MKYIALILLSITLSGCGFDGMAKAARDTGQRFDKYGCMARNFKGEPPCPQQELAQPSPSR